MESHRCALRARSSAQLLKWHVALAETRTQDGGMSTTPRNDPLASRPSTGRSPCSWPWRTPARRGHARRPGRDDGRQQVHGGTGPQGRRCAGAGSRPSRSRAACTGWGPSAMTLGAWFLTPEHLAQALHPALVTALSRATHELVHPRAWERTTRCSTSTKSSPKDSV